MPLIEPGYLLGTMTAGKQVRSAGIENREIFGDGVAANRIFFPGDIPKFLTAGIAAPTGVLVFSSVSFPGNINVSAGHEWAVSFYDHVNDRESMPLRQSYTSGFIGLWDAKLNSIPVDASASITGTTRRRIYRTMSFLTGGAPGSTLFYVGEIANNTSTTFTDAMNEATLVGQPIHDEMKDIAPPLNLFVSAFGRIFGAKQNTNDFYWSIPAEPDYWPASNAVTGLELRGGLVAMERVGPYVLMFGRDEILRVSEVSGTAEAESEDATYRYETIVRGTGAVGQESVKTFDYKGKEWCFFLSERGLYGTDGNAVEFFGRDILPAFGKRRRWTLGGRDYGIPQIEQTYLYESRICYVKQLNEIQVYVPYGGVRRSSGIEVPVVGPLLLGAYLFQEPSIPILGLCYVLDSGTWRPPTLGREVTAVAEMLGDARPNNVYVGNTTGNVSEVRDDQLTTEGTEAFSNQTDFQSSVGVVIKLGGPHVLEDTSLDYGFPTAGIGMRGLPVIVLQPIQTGSYYPYNRFVFATVISNTSTKLTLSDGYETSGGTHRYSLAALPLYLRTKKWVPDARDKLYHLERGIIFHTKGEFTGPVPFRVEWMLDDEDAAPVGAYDAGQMINYIEFDMGAYAQISRPGAAQVVMMQILNTSLDLGNIHSMEIQTTEGGF